MNRDDEDDELVEVGRERVEVPEADDAHAHQHEHQHQHQHQHEHEHRHQHEHEHRHPRDDDRERGHRRGPLSEEVARRWAPERLMKMVSDRAGRGEPLDATTRARHEARLGVDLGGVRVYSGEFAENVTRAHGAEAVTVGGTGMVLMSGTPDRSPVTAAGRGLLAHELTHVAQAARGGGAGPSAGPGMHRSQAPGERVLATEEHEAEAEAVEAAEMGEGGGAAATASAADGARAEEQVAEKIRERVLELLEDDEWVSRVRGGWDPVRP